MKRKIIESTMKMMKIELVWTSMDKTVRPANDPDTEVFDVINPRYSATYS